MPFEGGGEVYFREVEGAEGKELNLSELKCFCFVNCIGAVLCIRVAWSDTWPFQKNSNSVKKKLQLKFHCKIYKDKALVYTCTFSIALNKIWIFLMYFFIYWKFPKFLDVLIFSAK